MPDYLVDPQERGLGPPNMAAQLFAMISGVPDAYQKGAEAQFKRGQMARTEALQAPYAGPFDPKTGMPDPAGIMRESMRLGGIEDAQKYVGPLLEMMAGNQISQSLGGGPPQQPRMSPTDQRATELGGRPQPALSSAGTDDKGNDTVRSLATERGINVDSPAIKQEFGRLGIDTELDPAQAAAVVKRFAALTKGNTATDAQPTPAVAPAPPAPMAPQQPPATFAQRFDASGGPATPVGTEADAKFYEDRANARIAASATPFAKPAAAAAAQKAAEADFARAKDIRDTLAKYGEPTTEMKNARDQGVIGFERQKGIETHRTEDAFKRYASIEKAGQQAEDLHPEIAMARSLVNSPGFNGGIGRPFTDTMKQLSATLFGDPNAATPSQFFDKLRSGSILNEIRSLGGSGSGPVRVAEMKFIDSMYAGRDQQPPSIRAVVEVENRLTQRAKALYNMAQNYVQKHGQLDEGFNREVTDYKNRPGNAMFSKAELANPGLLSMPVFSSPAEMRASRMPRGTPFRNPDGEVGTIP
jgi:hypothetical protein